MRRKQKPSVFVMKEAPVDANKLYRFPEAAQRLGMSLNTLKARIKDGELAVCYTGKGGMTNPRAKGKRITGAEIARYISSREVRMKSS